MGTNYYTPDGKHIGKQSAGWRFLVDVDTFLPMWEDIVRKLASLDHIVDEYGEKHTVSEFIDRVWGRHDAKSAPNEYGHQRSHGQYVGLDGPVDGLLGGGDWS